MIRSALHFTDMKREEFIKDINNMETIMSHTVNSDSNGWQYVYWLSVAVWHILIHLIRRYPNGKTDHQEDN